MTKKSKALKDHKIIIKNNIKINTGTDGKSKNDKNKKKSTKKQKFNLRHHKNARYNPNGIPYYSGGSGSGGGAGSIPLSSAGITQSSQLVTKTNKAEYDLQPYTKPITSKQPAQLLLTNGPSTNSENTSLVVASSATTKPPKIKATRIKTIKTGTNLDHIKKQGLYEQYKKLGVPVRKNDTKNELNRKYQIFLTQQQNKQKSPNTGPRVDEVTTDDDKPTTNKPFVHFENQQEPAENKLHQQTTNNHLLNSTGFKPKRVDTPFKPAKLITDIDESPINENIQVRTIKQTPSRLFTTVDEEEEPTKWNTADEPIDNGFVTVNSNDDEILPETPVTNDTDPFETSGDEYFKQTPPNHNKQHSLRASSLQSVGKFSHISPEEAVAKSKRGRKPGSTNKPKEPSQFTKKLALGLIERTNPVGRPKQTSEAQTASLLTEKKHNQIRHHKAGEGVSQFTAQTADNEPDGLFNNNQGGY